MNRTELLDKVTQLEDLFHNASPADEDQQKEVDLVYEICNGIREYLESSDKKINRNLEAGRLGQLQKILRENPTGVEKDKILSEMNISKGNLSSLLIYLKEGGIDWLKLGSKIILAEFVKVGV